MTIRNSHSFVDLSDGRCHYRLDGPEDGTPVLMIHGATVPLWEFDRFVPYLTAAGFRTLRLDLYGHGYSDRPRASHDYPLFVRQVREFLDHVDPRQPVHLLGHSLGAVIAARVMLETPNDFGAIVMGAPMLDFLGQAKASRLLNVPLIGEAFVHGYVVPMLVRRRTERYAPIEDGRFVGMFKDQLAMPGFGRALLSLMQSGALRDQSAVYERLGAVDNRVLLLRGADDVILGAGQFETMRSLVADARSETIADTAHAMVLTHPEKVAPHVLEFLGGTRQASPNAS